MLINKEHGLLPRQSTVWQLLTVLEEWENAINNGDFVHACFLDVVKAFELVDHALLQVKVKFIGIVNGPIFTCMDQTHYLNKSNLRRQLVSNMFSCENVLPAQTTFSSLCCSA